LAWALRIQLCGHLAIDRGGVRVEARLPGRQGARLLAYLAANLDRWVTRDELADAVWGDHPPADVGGALAPLLSKVRRVVGPEHVEGRSSLRFVASDDTLVDMHWAFDALHRAESAMEAGDWREAYQPAHTAHLIGSRTFMLGHEAPWIDEWRPRMADVGIRGLECHVRSLLEVPGESRSETERTARALVHAAPFRESGYRLLMEALERTGNRAEALRVFEDLRQLLADELGTTPDPQTTEMHEHLLRLGVRPAQPGPAGRRA
jgi:SARP family transcriptional regulator, regulator of embCAB operon